MTARERAILRDKIARERLRREAAEREAVEHDRERLSERGRKLAETAAKTPPFLTAREASLLEPEDALLVAVERCRADIIVKRRKRAQAVAIRRAEPERVRLVEERPLVAEEQDELAAELSVFEPVLDEEIVVPVSEHGTNSGYCQGCRCADCRAAHTDYARAWRRTRNPNPRPYRRRAPAALAA